MAARAFQFLAQPPMLGRGRCEMVLEGHTGIVNAVAVLPDRRCITVSSDQTGRVWDLTTGACELELRGHASAVGRERVGIFGFSERVLRRSHRAEPPIPGFIFLLGSGRYPAALAQAGARRFALRAVFDA